MEFFITPMSEPEAMEICAWRYGGEYSVYDFAPWEQAVAEGYTMTDPACRKKEFRSVVSEHGLCGFFRMSRDDNGDIEIGLGMKPELCGLGLGQAFTQAASAYVRAAHPAAALYLEVRTFNARAAKCYERCGYHTVCRHTEDRPWGRVEYFRMEYSPD